MACSGRADRRMDTARRQRTRYTERHAGKILHSHSHKHLEINEQ